MAKVRVTVKVVGEPDLRTLGERLLELSSSYTEKEQTA